jgi:hypothetical protein
MASMEFHVDWNRPGANWVVRLGEELYGAYLTKGLHYAPLLMPQGRPKQRGMMPTCGMQLSASSKNRRATSVAHMSR